MAGPIALVAVLSENSSHQALQEIPDEVAFLEVKGDLANGISAAWLRGRFVRQLLYSPGNHLHNGLVAGSLAARHQTLIRAAREYDLIRLDADFDLSPEVLAAVPAQKRLISWEGRSGDVAHLRSIFKRLSAVPARFYSQVSKASQASDGMRPLLLLKELGRKDVMAFCEGKFGLWSRLLAPHFGAPLVFGSLDPHQASDSGDPSIRQLMEDYGFPQLQPVRELYGMVGDRISQSPSPRLHNAGYRALGHPALFLPFHVEYFEEFWREIIEGPALESLGLSIKGLTIVSPYKEKALAAAARHSPMARKSGATNIFVRKNGLWEAHTTDPESIAGIGKTANTPSPLRVAVIGCGGAGRAIAAALHQAGADVTLVNRGEKRGELAVKLLGLPFVPLSDFRATPFSLLVNATPIGRDDDSVPFDIETMSGGSTVIDLAYGPRPTPLVIEALARGASVIDGHDVLLKQVRKQFQMMSGREMPASIGRHVVTSRAFVDCPLAETNSHGRDPQLSLAKAPSF